MNPLAPEPLYARATVATEAGDAAAAEAFYVQATRLQPENPATWYELGLFRYIAGDLCGAYFALNAAYTLDPEEQPLLRGQRTGSCTRRGQRRRESGLRPIGIVSRR